MKSSIYCECGCGHEPKPGHRFLHGHGGRVGVSRAAREEAHRRRDEIRHEAEEGAGRTLIYGECFCGCGTATKPSIATNAARGLVAGELALYLKGHGTRGKKLNKDPDYVVDDAGCWIWQKAQTRKKSGGYGHLWNGTRLVPAHRHYYELHVGPIPEGMEVHHRCGVKLCVNPEHLEPLTRADHMRLDGRAVPRQSPRGIPARAR